MWNFLRWTCLLAVAVYGSAVDVEAADEKATHEARESVIEYDRNPSTVVVELAFSGWSRHTEPPILQIFGDGTIVVTQPSHSRDRGVHECRLSENEMDDLLRYIEECGIMQFNERKVQQQIDAITNRRRQEAAAAGRPYESAAVADGSTVSIKVFLSKYESSKGSEQPKSDARFEVRWYSPRFYSALYPEVHELALLVEAERHLIQIIESVTK